jgi:hypothetical protein
MGPWGAIAANLQSILLGAVGAGAFGTEKDRQGADGTERAPPGVFYQRFYDFSHGWEWFERIGMTGFEPATPSSRTRCATKLRYIPVK